MSDKALADIICRALIAIVAGIRKRYGLPAYHNIDILIQDKPEESPAPVTFSTLAKPRG